MKTLIVLLLATMGLGAAYWKIQHPNATVDDVKAVANSTLERAKTGFAAFRNGSSTNIKAAAQEQDIQTNNRITSAESRIDASDSKFTEIDNKINQLNSSVDTLAGEITTVSSNLGNLNDNVAASAGENQGVDGLFDSMNQRVNELAAQLNEQDAEQTLTNIGTRIDSIDSRLSVLAQSNGQTLEANAQTLDEIDAKVTQVADQTSALEARINTLSVESSNNGDDEGNLRAQVDQRLQEIEAKLATTNSNSLRVSSLVERLNSADQQLTALSAAQTDAGSSSQRIDEMLAALEANTEQTAQLQNEFDAANEKIASLTEELSALKSTGSNASVESLQADLTGQLAQLESRIENTTDNTDISTLNTALATTRSRIQQLEQRIQDLPTDDESSQNAQAAQTNLQEQIVAMERRLRALPQQTDPKLLNTLNQVQADVAELRDRETSNSVEYKVYFGQSSVQISDEAAVVLKSVIRQEQDSTTGVNIYGFTDRSGDASFNQRLALQRATSVRSFLIQNGFDFTKIKSLSGLGEDAAAATLDDGAEDADQRTVVLVADQP